MGCGLRSAVAEAARPLGRSVPRLECAAQQRGVLGLGVEAAMVDPGPAADQERQHWADAIAERCVLRARLNGTFVTVQIGTLLASTQAIGSRRRYRLTRLVRSVDSVRAYSLSGLCKLSSQTEERARRFELLTSSSGPSGHTSRRWGAAIKRQNGSVVLEPHTWEQ
jgi:hypothetical protein